MQNRQKAWIAGGALVLALAAAVVARVAMRNNGSPDPTPVDPHENPPAFMQIVDMDSVPADVKAAAEALKSSRVGYAMPKADKTYLIISTGSVADRVKFDRAEGQPDLTNPTFIDIHLTSALGGDSLLIGTVSATGNVEYQFDVDGAYAAIPTLHNRHNLPLIHLDERTGFSLVSPKAGDMAGRGVLHVEGYARVFEAQFSATVITEKGRVLGSVPVMAGAGAPSWGSFAADIPFDTTDLPETGFLLLTEEMTGAALKVPVRLRQPAQLG